MPYDANKGKKTSEGYKSYSGWDRMKQMVGQIAGTTEEDDEDEEEKKKKKKPSSESMDMISK